MEQIWPEAMVESFEAWNKLERGSNRPGIPDGVTFFRNIIDSCSLLLSSEGTFSFILNSSIESRIVFHSETLVAAHVAAHLARSVAYSP